MREIKNANEFVNGMKVVYTGDNNPYAKTIYDGEVIQVTKHFVTLRIVARQNTIPDMCFGNPVAYNRSISFTELGRTQKVYMNA